MSIKNLSMKLDRFGIVCPLCKGDLLIENHNDEELINCRICNLNFPVVQGIIDLHYPPNQSSQVVDLMLANYDQATFDELLSIILFNAKLPQSIIEDTLVYYHEQIKRSDDMTMMFLERLSRSYGAPTQSRALDLGCGSGAGVFSLSHHFNQVIGLDSSMAQLLLAKKTLDKLISDKFCLICASANLLPLKDNSLNYVQAINVLEHLMNTQPAIQELSRCLDEQGSFVADSRNRFDVFTPEPHTGIRFLGFLPRKIIPNFVKFCCDSQYEQTWLLSYFDLQKDIKKNFQGRFKIVFPKAQAYGKPAWIDKCIVFIEKIPLIRRLIIFLFSTHIVIAKKEEIGN
jgi:ubiquinone/menaquinone biosynthesis C-methylase UbiE